MKGLNHRPALVLLLGLGSLAGPAAAQSPAHCDQAVARALSSPLPRPQQPGAWDLVVACGTQRAISTMVSALATSLVAMETDRESLRHFFWLFEGQRDGRLFAAYTDAVVKTSGSEQFRVAAMRALVKMVEPDLGFHTVAPCGGNRQPPMGGEQIGASTLPSDAKDRVIATVTEVAASDAPACVRLAAKEARDMLELDTPVDGRKISIAYVCGDSFRIRNQNPTGVDLRFVVGNNLDAGEFGVSKRSEYVLTVSETGPLNVYLDNTLVGTQANGGTVCK